jgi:ribosomal protein S18 acetylase RimI-like enzyme
MTYDAKTSLSMRKMAPDDLPSVASCHRAAYGRDHFTSTFTQRMLEDFYRTLLLDNQYSYVAVDSDGKLCGFLVAGEVVAEEKVALEIRRFTKRNAHRLLIALLRNPRFVPGTVKVLSRWAKRAILGPVAPAPHTTETGQRFVSLRSIATVPALQKLGVASALIDQLEERLRAASIPTYRLSVRRSNAKAIAFYERRGLLREHESPNGIYYAKHLPLEGSEPP